MKKKLAYFAVVLNILVVLLFLSNSMNINLAKIEGYKALKVFAYVRNDGFKPQFSSYETEHFKIRFEPEDGDVVVKLGEILEKSYKIAAESYGYHPKEKTIVFVYSSKHKFWQHYRSIDGQAVMGLYSMGAIHILSPKAYERDYNYKIYNDFERRGPILHEYMHRVVDGISGGNMELWLTEGIALYEETKLYQNEWAPGFRYDKYFTAKEIRNNFMSIEEVQAYRQSYDMVAWLIDNYGREKVKALLSELGKGKTMDAAFLNIYGFDLNEFIDNYKSVTR